MANERFSPRKIDSADDLFAQAIAVLAELEPLADLIPDANNANTQAQIDLDRIRIDCEVNYTLMVGGEKELGSNAEARARTLAYHCNSDADYLAAQAAAHESAWELEGMKSRARFLERVLDLYLVAISYIGSAP